MGKTKNILTVNSVKIVLSLLIIIKTYIYTALQKPSGGTKEFTALIACNLR